jgi:hypothetical protein
VLVTRRAGSEERRHLNVLLSRSFRVVTPMRSNDRVDASGSVTSLSGRSETSGEIVAETLPP